MLKALAEGETNPAALAALADWKLRATPEQLCDALGACTDLNPVYRRLLKMALEQLQFLEQQIGQLDQRGGRKFCARPARSSLDLARHDSASGGTASSQGPPKTLSRDNSMVSELFRENSCGPYSERFRQRRRASIQLSSANGHHILSFCDDRFAHLGDHA
jgi:hypothetical protein